jgi:hypothetical protein
MRAAGSVTTFHDSCKPSWRARLFAWIFRTSKALTLLALLALLALPMRPLPVLLGSSLLAGLGAVLGSILGNAAGHIGLVLGALIGGALATFVAVLLATRLGWLPPGSRTGALLGGLVGFAIAAPIAVTHLGSPITPLASCALVGAGVLIGAGAARSHAAKP